MLDGTNCLQDCRSSKSHCKKMVAMKVSTPELQRNVESITPLFSLVLLMSVALRLSVEKNVCSLERHFGSSNPSKTRLLQVLPISSPVRDPKKILTLSNTIHHRHATVSSDLNDQDFVWVSPPVLATKRHTPPPACGLSPRKQQADRKKSVPLATSCCTHAALHSFSSSSSGNMSAQAMPVFQIHPCDCHSMWILCVEFRLCAAMPQPA